jgi:hypothetical protein
MTFFTRVYFLKSTQGDQGPMLWIFKIFSAKKWQKWRFWPKLYYAAYLIVTFFRRKLSQIAENYDHDFEKMSQSVQKFTKATTSISEHMTES